LGKGEEGVGTFSALLFQEQMQKEECLFCTEHVEGLVVDSVRHVALPTLLVLGGVENWSFPPSK